MGASQPHVLVLQHHRDGDPGRLLLPLRGGGFRVDIVRTDLGEAPPLSLDGYDAYISMGGDMFVSDVERHPFIATEQELFREAVSSDVPALGICLGGQILASALGAKVSRLGPTQIGWDVVEFARIDDPMVGHLAPEQLLFEWHHESFALPDGAVHLGGSPEVPVQAFRVASAWAFQFHLEIEPRHVEAWSASRQADRDLEALATSRPQLLRELAERLPGQASVADEVFCRFARLVQTHFERGNYPARTLVD